MLPNIFHLSPLLRPFLFRQAMIGKKNYGMKHLLGAPYGAVFELDGTDLVRVDGELVEAEEEPPGEIKRGICSVYNREGQCEEGN